MTAPSPGPAAIGPTGGAAVAETHAATVVFLGDRAYKVKKPVNLGFLDFSTPEARHRVCLRELELNRRFAPDVYLGVAQAGLVGGEPCEWLVVMRRMPADRRLTALLTTGEDVRGPLRALARQLAAHHATARRSERVDAMGLPDAVRDRWLTNLDPLEEFRDAVSGIVDGDLLDGVRHRALRYVDGRRPLFEARVAAGFVRDGHGDLLADDIFCLPDGPRALDCLEFDDDLRSLDGLDDAACLAMDLERLGAPEASRDFLDWFAEFSGRPRVQSLAHHYVAYRATMRAKVACLRWAQGVAGSATTAGRLLAIADRHLRAGDPTLVLVGGAPGTGKSTVAGRLADELGAVLLRSDRHRKELAGLEPATPQPAAWGTGLYTPAGTARTYDELLAHAGALLAMGETVVLDATWSSAEHREHARRTAAQAFSPIVELRCAAPADLAVERIRARRGTGDPSDADPDIARRLADDFEPWPEATVLETTAPRAVTAAAALDAVRPGGSAGAA
jgi:aminoglycoside phosphotransferase family enzyme/predicted kinase